MKKGYEADVEAILARRNDNGGDWWATEDLRIFKGSPFSTLESVLMLAELEMGLGHEGHEVGDFSGVMREAGALMLRLWREDGRFQVAPKSAIYPCQTASVARALCRLGYANDERLRKTFDHLLRIQHSDGGWRCNVSKFGKGPETAFSNPGTTLLVLDAFRFTPYLNNETRLDRAVESLLSHWETRKPLGSCHYGMGTLFMKVEYPFFRYNLFFYVYVLSFYARAKGDARFVEALNVLRSKAVRGEMCVENPNRKLAEFSFCRKGEVSALATLRFGEILRNVEKNV